MTDPTRLSTEHDNTIPLHSNPSSCPIPRAPQSTSGILCEPNKSNWKTPGGDGGTSVEGKQSEKLSKKSKASFRLPGTKKRRKEQQQQKQQKVSRSTKSLTTEPLPPSNLQQLTVNDAVLPSSAKHSKSEKRPKKERGGLGLLGREARDSRRKSKRDGRFTKASKADYPQNTQDPVRNKAVFIAMTDPTRLSTEHDNTIPLHSNPSSCPIPRAPQSTSGILCEPNKSNWKTPGGDGGTSVEGKQSEKLSKKSKASFRLPGTKKRRKEQQQQKQQKVSRSTKSLTTEPLPPSNLQQLTVNDAVLPSSAKHSKSEKRPKKERGGLGLLGREARDSRRKSKRDGRFTKASKADYPQNTQDPVRPVFGVPLNVAFERNPSHDGIPLPAFFRHCIDYIEMYGLCSESIYRVSLCQFSVLLFNVGAFCRFFPE
ncbi:hypothetical protein AHF37_09671 [Paragonimus kellicotti]|nr:hypothetical protein AHF37_09671 [Paragonimus kellicotti]